MAYRRAGSPLQVVDRAQQHDKGHRVEGQVVLAVAFATGKSANPSATSR